MVALEINRIFCYLMVIWNLLCGTIYKLKELSRMQILLRDFSMDLALVEVVLCQEFMFMVSQKLRIQNSIFMRYGLIYASYNGLDQICLQV